jgi:hypothetical protein
VWLGLLFAVAGLIALLASRRGPAGTAWTVIGPGDPRVAGVFRTLDSVGLAAALDSLEGQASHDSLVLRSGHQLAHALGRQAFTSGGESDTIIADCRADFSSGCYHGVVEASLTHHRTVDMAALERMCAAAGVRHSGSMFECVHGVGHGILGASGDDVVGALHFCDRLSSDVLRGSCHEGVFMEAITTALAGSGHHSGHAHGMPQPRAETHLAIDPADPYSPCRGYQDEYGQACWLFQGFLILRAVQFDAERALRICDRAPRGWVDRCSQSVGHQLTGLFQRDNRWVIDQCRSGPPHTAAQCGAGAVLALLGEDWSGGGAREFCQEVPSSWQKECLSVYHRRMAALRGGPLSQ